MPGSRQTPWMNARVDKEFLEQVFGTRHFVG